MAGNSVTPSRSFELELWDGPVEDQKRSGRCWIYASLNPLRQQICQRFGLPDFRFSTNYIYFFDQLQKSREFLDRVQALKPRPLEDPELSDLLREPVSSVGQWCYFAALADRFGLVPQAAMPDTADTTDGQALTRDLSRLLRRGAWALRGCSEANWEAVRENVLAQAAALLQRKLGLPPETFSWQGRQYTPLQFMRDVCVFNPHASILLIHHPSQRWKSPCAYHETEDPEQRNSLLTLFSVDMETLKALALRQLRDGEQVVIGCDVRYAGNRKDGLLDLALDSGVPTLPKAEAIAFREVKACHVMSIDGWARDGRWRVQDSHGAETGPDGHYVMTDAWFDAYGLSAVVKKKYLSPDLREALALPAIYMPKTERF